MAAYTYKVRDRSGKLMSGNIEAENQAQAVERLRARNLFVVEVRQLARSAKGQSRQLSFGQGRVSGKQLALFTRQFATLIGSGVSLISCLRILIRQSDNSRLKATLEQVAVQVEAGYSLHEAMAAHPRVFPIILVNMVETGEVGGMLDDVLERMADHFEREYDMIEKVKSALSYPAIIMGIAFVAVLFLLTFVLPRFAEMLTSMDAPMPAPTLVLMTISGLMRRFWYLVPALLVGGGYAGWNLAKLDAVKQQLDRYILRAPVVGDLLRKMIIARFARTLGTMVRSGVPIIQALEVSRKVVNNRLVADGIAAAQVNVRQGQSLAAPLVQCGVFPPMVTQMVAVGEETGALDSMLEKIAQFYDREVNTMVDRLAAMLEPLLIVGTGLVVGGIVMAILLPMFSIISNVQ